MIENVSPLVVIILPAFGIAQLRHRWSFYFVLASVPFFSLALFSILGKRLLLPELAIIGLAARQGIIWIRQQQIKIPNKGLIWLFGFLCVSLISIISVAIVPASGEVHPYNVGGFINYELVPIVFSTSTLTQFIYRSVTVFAIITIATNLTYRRILITIRWIVYSSLIVGFTGVVYQISRVLNFYTIPALFQSLGFMGFYETRGTLGSFPRMYSSVGEPGYTSAYLLFGFSVIFTIRYFDEENSIFYDYEELFAMALLVIFLILSTGTTGYGGLVIFSAVLLFTVFFLRTKSVLPLLKVGMLTTLGIISIIGIITTVLQLDILQIATYQLQKLMFGAGSGTIRIWYIKQVHPLLLQRPLFGVGVGVHYSPIMLFGIVIETGALGLTTYGLAHVYAFRDCLSRITISSELSDPVAASLFVGGVTLTSTILLAQTITALRFPWYWLAVALPMAYENSPTQE